MALYIDNIILICQIFLVIFIMIASGRLINRGNNLFLAIFFTFAMVSWLLSDLYWLAFDVMYSGSRMPLAANELGECAMFLLLSAGISSYRRKDEKISLFCFLYPVLFTVANVFLWIVWSGEWLQDILCGIAMCVLTFSLLQVSEQQHYLSQKIRVRISVVSLMVILFQGLSTFLPGPVTRIPEYVSYVIMYAVVVRLFVLAIHGIAKKEKTKPFIYTLSAFVLATFTLYMSPGIIYTIIFASLTLMSLLLYYTFRREGRADDLC